VRRFLVDRLPPTAPDSETVVRQVFWRLGDGWTLRLRRSGPAGGASVDALTVEPAGIVVPVSADQAAALFKAGRAHRLVAERRTYGPVTVDSYVWENEGLVVASVDGPPPTWCGREVTADPQFAEESLAYDPRPSR
jgi:hypothetical protein